LKKPCHLIHKLKILDQNLEKLDTLINEREPEEEKKEEDNKSEESIDMFNVDSNDEDDDQENYIGKAVKEGFHVVSQDINVNVDGYYQPKVGEIVNNRYKIISIAGRGMFS
jgi:septal ring-binding cell division protein DamX